MSDTTQIIPPFTGVKRRGWRFQYMEELMTTPGLSLTDEQLAQLLDVQPASVYCLKWRVAHRTAYEKHKAVNNKKNHMARLRQERKRVRELATAVKSVKDEQQLELPLPPPPPLVPTKADMVNSPPHYLVGGIETYDFISAKLTVDELRGYLRGNVLKYASRAGHKGSSAEDVGKLAWYATKLHELEEKNG